MNTYAFYYYLLGVISASLFILTLIKKAKITRVSGETFAIEIPVIGNSLTFQPKDTQKIFTEDYIKIQSNFSPIGSLLDLQMMMKYAIQYNIDYITTEGDLSDGNWSEGRYAFCTMSRSHKREFAIHINPYLDTEDVSKRLSEELGKRILPHEVYPFLFLHEIGHTSKAGNKNYFSAVINHTISGDRHSLSKRRELFRLKSEIEDFADRFALKELRRWKK